MKTHLRGLFERFVVGDPPQDHERAKLVEVAFHSGAVGDRDL